MSNLPAQPTASQQPSTSPAAIVAAQQLGKRVPTPSGELVILEDINVHIQAGESIAIVGASGSGKSALLGLLAGLDTPTDGHVELAGQNLTRLDEDGRAHLRAQFVGFVFQAFQLLPSLNALENAMLPLELAGRADAHTRATEVLERVGLGARLDHYPRQLSGGEQQRVAIARAYAASPQVLFADEPTGNLDHATGARIAELLFELNQEHTTTLILVTHDRELASHCDRRIEITAGRVVNSCE